MDYSQLVQDVLDGNESALKAYAILKTQLEFFKDCVNQVEPSALDEAENHDGKTFKLQGYKFTKRAGGKRWDFSNLQEWKKAKEDLKTIEDKAKAAYSNYSNGLLSVNLDGGEIQDLPVVKFSKDSISIKKV